MSKFSEILAHRGRIVLFTPNAAVGLRYEQCAERTGALVVHTRGWADMYGPMHTWWRAHHARDFAVLSCDQVRYFNGIQIAGTDFVWVGNCFDHPLQLQRHHKAAQMAFDHNARLWTLGESDL